VAFRQSEYEVSSLQDLLWSSSTSRFEVLASWRGFDTAEDNWEPLSSLATDVPQLLQRFFDRHKDTSIAQNSRAVLLLESRVSAFFGKGSDPSGSLQWQ
jgi:hypothetical protein